MHRLALPLAVLISTAAWGSDPLVRPADVALGADDLATLSGGDIVIRMDGSDSGAVTVAVVDVKAPPRAVLDAVLDVTPRVAEVGAIKAVEVYDHVRVGSDGVEHLGIRWQLGVMGRTVVFHTLYDVDRERGFCVYRLDGSRENDVVSAEGSYLATPMSGGSRLVYRSVSDSGVSVPQWLRSWFASGSLKEQLNGIRQRAESSVTQDRPSSPSPGGHG